MSNVPNAEQCKAQAAKLVNLAWSRETDERAALLAEAHIEQTARGQLHGIPTRELVEKVRDAADKGLLTLNDVRRLQAMTTDWCRAQGFAVNPST